MVKLIPGKIYRLGDPTLRKPNGELSPFLAGDTTTQVISGKTDEDGNDIYDFAMISIPNGSVMLYIGIHYYDVVRTKSEKKTIESYSFLYGEKVILFHKSQINKDNGKYLTILI